MILEKLANYYDMMQQTGYEMPRLGYALLYADFAFILNEDGTLHAVEALKEQETRKELLLPFWADHTNTIAPFFAWDNASYALGLPCNARNYKKLEAFYELQKKLLQNHCAKEAYAFLQFLQNWKPQLASKNKLIKPYYWDIIRGSHIVFRLHGQTEYFHALPSWKNLWETHLQCSFLNNSPAHCMLTGTEAQIALTHMSIKNLEGANPKGAALISFNNEAFCSYHKQQGMNAPLSVHKTFAFHTALNHLLKIPYQKTLIGNTTFVTWADCTEKNYTAFVNFFLNSLKFNTLPADKQHVYKTLNTEKHIVSVLECLQQYKAPEPALLKLNLNPEAELCLLGITPNNARISVDFWYHNSIRNFLLQITSYYYNIYIHGMPHSKRFLCLNELLTELMPQKHSYHKTPTAFTVSLLRAILENKPYPTGLYNRLLRSIIADKQVTPLRAGFIKAYFTEQYKTGKLCYKESIGVSLNKENNNIPYCLGRLFAVIEKAQQKRMNTDSSYVTIKDKYFATAMAAPASVFPVLMKLSVYDTRKAKHGSVLEKQKGNILSFMEAGPLPTRLSTEEQGLFILGYYHQYHSFYRKALRSNKEA